MLAGEYAVLRGAPALAATLDSKLNVTLTTNTTDGSQPIRVCSDIWQEEKSIKRNEPTDCPLLAAVASCTHADLASVSVESKLDSRFGIGSSSALRLGVCIGDAALNEQPMTLPSKWEAAERGYRLQKDDQSFASGYDFATQLLGGAVIMHPTLDEHWPGSVGRFSHLLPSIKKYIHPFIGGTGAPTGSVTKDTVAWMDQENKWSELLECSDRLINTMTAFLLLEQEDQDIARDLFTALKEHRRFFAASPHFPMSLAGALQNATGCDTSWSFKTSGAGGEDAILLFGRDEDITAAASILADNSWAPLPHRFSDQGAEIRWEN